MTGTRLHGVALSGFAVEFGWAVGESVMIPRLLGLGLSPAIAGLIFLVNPVFSVFLGPYLGAASDKCQRCHRRVPFIAAYSLFAVLGFAVLVLLGGENIFVPFISPSQMSSTLLYIIFCGL